jgi:hypothetical protein
MAGLACCICGVVLFSLISGGSMYMISLFNTILKNETHPATDSRFTQCGGQPDVGPLIGWLLLYAREI